MDKRIIYMLIAVNIVTFLVYGWDKLCARKDWWRIPERVLLGGSLGALLGMNAFRHKTKHRKFTVFVPLFLVFQIAFAVKDGVILEAAFAGGCSGNTQGICSL